MRFSILYTRHAAQACTGGFTSPNAHSYAGNCPFGCMYHSRSRRMSCSLAKSGSTSDKRNRVKRQVPRRKPRILPFVGHREHVGVVQVRPIVVAPLLAFRRRRRLAGIALQPRPHVVVIALLGPQHARKRLAHDAVRVLRPLLRKAARVELVRFATPQFEHLLELVAEWIRCSRLWAPRWSDAAEPSRKRPAQSRTR